MPKLNLKTKKEEADQISEDYSNENSPDSKYKRTSLRFSNIREKE